MAAAAPAPTRGLARDRLVRRMLTAAGLSEAVTFGIHRGGGGRRFRAAERQCVRGRASPIRCRPNSTRCARRFLPGLVDAVAHNRRHGRRDVALFEIGARFTADGRNARRRARVDRDRLSRSTGPAPPREVDFFDVKGVVEQLCGALGVAVRVEPAATPFLVDGTSAAVLSRRSSARRDRSGRA